MHKVYIVKIERNVKVCFKMSIMRKNIHNVKMCLKMVLCGKCTQH